MGARLLDFALHACVLLAAANTCSFVARWRPSSVSKSRVLVVVLSIGGVLSLAMSASWYRLPVAVVPWSGIFVLLAGVWQGLIAASMCASILACAAVLLHAAASVPVMDTWAYEMLVTMLVALGAPPLLHRIPPRHRELVVLTFGGALATMEMGVRPLTGS